MTYMATPWHKNPCPEGHKDQNFGRPFLSHYYYIHVFNLSDSCPGVEMKIFSEIHQIYTNLSPLGVGDHEISSFSSPYPTDAAYILN